MIEGMITAVVNTTTHQDFLTMKEMTITTFAAETETITTVTKAIKTVSLNL